MIRFVLLTAVLAEQECSWKRINSCTDQIEGAVFFDDVFNENESVLIKDMAVIIRGDVTVEKIRIDKCGYLTVLDSDKPIKINAMHIDVVDGGELQVLFTRRCISSATTVSDWLTNLPLHWQPRH